MAKSASIFVCNNCAYETSRWLGQCPGCREWNTFEETSIAIPLKEMGASKLTSQKLADIQHDDLNRISSGFTELDRVLGGGMVPAEVVLISGEPGIGKSTLLLQVLAKQKRSLYVSAEESLQQVALRGKRLKLKSDTDLQIVNGFEINAIMQKIREEKPEIVVIDSIQTVYSDSVRGLPGGVSQIKSVASELIKFAKGEGIILFIVGQVTKEGAVAGPKLLEHLVDVVLEIEGDSKLDYRVLRCFKNRFGPTSEIGIFEMTELGLAEVLNPSLYFTQSEAENRIGVCPGVIMEGNRLIIVELQALTTRTFFPLPRRVAEGISKTRLEVLTAILAKYTKYDLGDKDVYVNIAGGLKAQESMLDLAVALAMISSHAGIELPKNLVAFGEITLTGQIRISKRAEQIKRECKRLGYKTFNEVYPHINSVNQLFLLFKKDAKQSSK